MKCITCQNNANLRKFIKAITEIILVGNTRALLKYLLLSLLGKNRFIGKSDFITSLAFWPIVCTCNVG